MFVHDPALVRLGRQPARADARNLKFSRYITVGALPKVPDHVDNGQHVKQWGMLANDRLGDCTCAGILHAIMLWRSFNGPAPAFADADALMLYQNLCGYRIGDPSTDQGGVELDILKAWRKAPIKGAQLTGFVQVNPKNWMHVKTALYLFGTLYMGLALPNSAQKEKVWTATNDAPGSWGGHCTVASAYADRALCLQPDTLTCITWGQQQVMTRQWLATYCDELYALLSPDWFDKAGKAPNGFDLEQLQADLAQL